MPVSGRSAIAIVWAFVLAIGACSESTQPDWTTQDLVTRRIQSGTVVSGPLYARSELVASGSSAASLQIFVSMPPGTLASGDSVQLTVVGATGAERSAPMFDGGFDPVGIDAGDADSLDVTVFASSARHVARLSITRNRQPSVIRTTPPRGRTDVPLDQKITIVFSQPIDPLTVTGTSVELTTGGATVPVTVAFTPERPWDVTLVPTSPLAPNATYEIVVDGTISDLNGLSLASDFTSDFTTGVQATAGITRLLPLCDRQVGAPAVMQPGDFTLSTIGGAPPPFQVPPFHAPLGGEDSITVKSGSLRINSNGTYALVMPLGGQWNGYSAGNADHTGPYQLCGTTLDFYGSFNEPTPVAPTLILWGTVSADVISVTMYYGFVYSDGDGFTTAVFTRNP